MKETISLCISNSAALVTLWQFIGCENKMYKAELNFETIAMTHKDSVFAKQLMSEFKEIRLLHQFAEILNDKRTTIRQ